MVRHAIIMVGVGWGGGAERSDPMIFRIIFDYLIATNFIGLIAVSFMFV